MSFAACHIVKSALLIALVTLVQAREARQSHQSNCRTLQSAEQVGSQSAVRSLKALTRLFVAISPASAFGHSDLGAGSCVVRHRLASHVRLCVAVHNKAPSAKLWPCGDRLDKDIGSNLVSFSLTSLILPLTGWIDLFAVGRLRDALALAGQASGDQVYQSLGILNVVRTVTQSAVGKAHGAGDKREVERQVAAGIFASTVLGVMVTAFVGLLSGRLPLWVGSEAALPFARPYLQWRLPGVVPETVAVVAASALRGMGDKTTPLIVTGVSCITNAVGNFVLMFPAKLGITGAALATSISQIVAVSMYFSVFFRRNVLQLGSILRLPSRDLLSKLAKSVGWMQVRGVAFIVALLTITKYTQGLDTTGVGAAAHSVTINYFLTLGVISQAMGEVTNVITSAELGKKDSTPEVARAKANRCLAWALLLGTGIGALQLFLFPCLGLLVPLEEVRKAARVPTLIGAAMQPLYGLVYAGENLMFAAGNFGLAARGSVLSVIALLIGLQVAPSSVGAVWVCFWLLLLVRLINVAAFWFSKSAFLPVKDKAA